MKNQLAKWHLEVNDKSIIDKFYLKQSFWPGFKQPKTEKVKNDFKRLPFEPFCSTARASIGYQHDDNLDIDYWMLYNALK